jgi:hypothetical protein
LTPNEKCAITVRTNSLKMQVRDLAHFLELLHSGQSEFYILLNGGLKSSKRISLLPDETFYILNYIDDTEQELTQKELFDSSRTNIGAALMCGAFYLLDTKAN